MKSHFQQSIRFARPQLQWLDAETKRLRISVNALVRQLVDDVQTFFGLPPSVAASLEKDRTTMGLDRRRYLQELLTRRYATLLRAELEEESRRS